MQHRGPHPPGYHDWVHRSLFEIDRAVRRKIANGILSEADAPQRVIQLFTQWVIDPVMADPVSMRYDWWRCVENPQ